MQTEARVGVVVESGGQIMRRQQYQALKDQQPQIGAVAHLISGGVAGAFSKTCTAPLGRITILFQVSFSLWPLFYLGCQFSHWIYCFFFTRELFFLLRGYRRYLVLLKTNLTNLLRLMDLQFGRGTSGCEFLYIVANE